MGIEFWLPVGMLLVIVLGVVGFDFAFTYRGNFKDWLFNRSDTWSKWDKNAPSIFDK